MAVVLNQADGATPTSLDEQQQLVNAGYMKCYNNGSLKAPGCNFHLSPQQQSDCTTHNGYYTCPKCNFSYDMLDNLPSWKGGTEESYVPGGVTKQGMPNTDQGQIGEDLVKHLGELPGYGPIVWWHPGTASSASPLDAATKEWGIEIKTIGYDAIHHRFIPGRQQEKMDKNQMCEKMKLQGVLGILVLLDYRRSVADIYAKEMPISGWMNHAGRYQSGVAAFRKNTGQHLLEEVPFHNPFADPANPSPVTPQSIDPVNQQGESMPF